jgi:glycine/D-amino acid oxidase-like deaminating enzyme
MSYAVAVVGCGPLGAATARQLSAANASGVVLVGADAAVSGAFQVSGGSVCWHRPDPVKASLIKETAEHVLARVTAGAQIRVRETPYLFLETGVLAPALNLASADLVADMVGEAASAGVERRNLGRILAVDQVPGGHRVVGENGTLDAAVVVLALGTTNPQLVPSLPNRIEKRQLFVLDLPVDDDRARLPHVIAPIGDGYVYVFVKDTDDGLRVLVGQEDLVADEDLDGPVDHFTQLLEAGAADRFPFLDNARVERILWGPDWADKFPHIMEQSPGLITVNCGSAVRTCIPTGRRTAAAALESLARGR